MNSIIVKAPAKVNLFLKVLGKRKDSYHDILTLFEKIRLADTIKISKALNSITVESDIPITRDPKDNLVYKAAKLALERGKIKSGVKIEIKKRIPIAAGLGGGSSDAAAVLIGINKLFKMRLNDKVLHKIAQKLGADVPFFVLDTTFAIGKGRGDELKVVKSGKRFWHLIVKAGSKTSTEDIYKAFDSEIIGASKRLTPRQESARIQLPSQSTCYKKGASADSLAEAFSNLTSECEGGQLPSKLRMDFKQIESMLYNDLERVSSLKKGLMGSLLKSLAQLLNKKVIISGSGPSLFCLYRARREAARAKEVVLRSVSARSRSGWQIFIA